jgi:6-phosphofructokinase 1
VAECAVRSLARQRIDVLFTIGGNDSAETGLMLSRVGARLPRPGGETPPLRIIGIPKTIDNDLPGMDHAPGYGSVARFWAIAAGEASLDTRAMRRSDPVKVLETMGRNSGWIVAAASLGKRREADGPHLLYFPERAFELNRFLTDVRGTLRRFGHAVVVISETIRDRFGRRVGSAKRRVRADRFGHPYVEGAAEYLCSAVELKLGIRSRFDKPGTIQRMAMGYVSKIDQLEAYRCGTHAVRLALNQKSGVMVAMERVSDRPYRIRYGSIPLERVAGQEKKLPASFINAEGNFATAAFRRYALPLIGGDLPEHGYLA